MKVVVLNASPRRDGNSAEMARQAARGVTDGGHDVETVFLVDEVREMLDNCRTCRNAAGRCSIDDGYETVLLDKVLPAQGLLLATPLHYYGMSARLKSFIDRLFCHTSNSAPDRERVLAALPHKKVGLLIACEETYPGATASVVAQVQEVARYLRHDFVGSVVGIGNTRGELKHDPARPLDRSYELGSRLLTSQVTDYRFDTPRSTRVWSADGVASSP